MHPSNLFRTSNKMYRSRPPANCEAARIAWDTLSAEAPLLSLRLLDGLWMCSRSEDLNETLDYIEAIVVANMVPTARACNREARNALAMAI